MIGGRRGWHVVRRKSQGLRRNHLKQLKTKYEKRIACLKHGRLTDILMAFGAGAVVMFWIFQAWYCK